MGRPEVVATRVERLGLRLKQGEQFDLIDPNDDPRFNKYSEAYHNLLGRRGVSPRAARGVVRTSSTVIAALALHLGDADAMICGTIGSYRTHLKSVSDVIGKAPGVEDLSALTLLILAKGSYFLADTHVTYDPTAEELAEMTIISAKAVRRLGIEPRVALLSHSNFGSTDYPSAQKVRSAVERLHARNLDFEVDGEMHGDAALNEAIRKNAYPASRLLDAANLLVFPSLDSANLALNLLRETGGGLSVGPMLVGTRAPAHILNTSVTARGVVNMSAIAVVDAQDRESADSA